MSTSAFSRMHVFVNERDAHYLQDGLETIFTGVEEIKCSPP